MLYNLYIVILEALLIIAAKSLFLIFTLFRYETLGRVPSFEISTYLLPEIVEGSLAGS